MRALPILLVMALLLAGCTGSSSDADPASVPASSETAPPSPTETEPNDTFVPKFHTHDYWSGRPSITLFAATLDIAKDALKETYIEDESLIVGRVDFDTKTDGEDVNLGDKTDVVYQGTSHIEVTIKWADATQIPGLRFSYKPANTPTFIVMGPVTSGETYSIELKEHWADMPHQMSLSRWKFRLEAYDPATNAYPVKAFRAQGKVDVTMTIFNGGERFIDPPHPYFFTSGPTRYAGELNATMTNCIVANSTRPAGTQTPVPSFATGCSTPDGPLNYKVAAPHIIPWETTRVLVSLYYNYTGQAPTGVKLGLKFHGSESDVYRYPAPTSKGDNWALYEMSVTEAMTDSPYADQSDWRFGVYPILQDQRDHGGEFTGNLHIHVLAIKDGDTGRGMGN